MIYWPAIIKLHGDQELIYLENQQHWESDPDIRSTKFQPADRLYDARGKEYLIHHPFMGELEPSGAAISIEDAILLIRQHAAQDGACCVSKIDARSYEEAFKLIAE